MAAKQNSLDKYANMAAQNIEEAVAGTAVYQKFAFPFSIMDKMGLLLTRVEYYIRGLTGINSTGDSIVIGLSIGQGYTDLEDVEEPGILDHCKLTSLYLGTAASGLIIQSPVVKDFTNLPGGGVLVAPNPLYAFIRGTGLGAVAAGAIRLYYTYMEMAADEYWQLVESRRIITN